MYGCVDVRLKMKRRKNNAFTSMKYNTNLRFSFCYRFFRIYGNGIIESFVKALYFKFGEKVYLKSGKGIVCKENFCKDN